MRLQNQGFIRHLLFLLLFVSSSLILYFPALNRNFSSDDYCILQYLFTGNGYLIPGFFRPVGDLTLKWTYEVFGWNSFYFFITNVILHGINTWLMFLFCSKLIKKENIIHRSLPFIAALIFLTYHSVGEVVLWTIGRGISLATSFALLSMIIFVSSIPVLWKYFLVSIFYFIGLACYESVLLLPFLLLAIAWLMKLETNYAKWTVILMITLGVSMTTRYIFTDDIWAGYNGVIFARDMSAYFFNFIKTSARVFVPPVEKPLMFVLISIISVSLIIVALIKAGRKNLFRARIISIALTGIFISLLVSMFFGVSTRNSEGDRLLYFSSIFYSLLIACLFTSVRNNGIRNMLLAVFIAAQVYFLIDTGKNWVKASAYAGEIIDKIKEYPIRPLYLVNLPSDYKGAYIFRNCLREALVHHNADSSEIVIVNYLRGDNSSQGSILPRRHNESFYIWPQTNIQTSGDTITYFQSGRKRIESAGIAKANILYWNNEQLLPLK